MLIFPLLTRYLNYVLNTFPLGELPVNRGPAARKLMVENRQRFSIMTMRLPLRAKWSISGQIRTAQDHGSRSSSSSTVTFQFSGTYRF